MSDKRRSNRRRVGAQHGSTPRVEFESRQTRVDNIISTSPQLLVAFSLESGMTCHAFRADTAEQQSELERRLKLIQSGLDVIAAIWKQGSTGSTE